MNRSTDQSKGQAGFVYMLKCRDGSFYTGWTTDIKRRVRVHNSGHGAKYTRSRLPVALVYLEKTADKSTALRREAAVRKLTHAQKQKLIESLTNLMNDIEKRQER